MEFAGKWEDVENIRLTVVSQKDKYDVFSRVGMYPVWVLDMNLEKT